MYFCCLSTSLKQSMPKDLKKLTSAKKKKKTLKKIVFVFIYCYDFYFLFFYFFVLLGDCQVTWKSVYVPQDLFI